MANYAIMIFLLAFTLQSWGQSVDPAIVDELDSLDQEKILLQKQLDVAKLQGELDSATRKGSPVNTSSVPTAELKAVNLKLVKVTGLESAPQAVFLYNGFRMVADKGGMVLPTVQLRVVTATHVTIKDIKTGVETVLWLSPDQG